MPNKVYYNSACPVCNAGIKDQKQRMDNGGIKDIEWVDIHNNPDAVSEVDTPLEKVRERLYFKDANGQINIGADAFIQLWLQTPGQRWLGKLCQLPVIKQCFHLVYNGFARLLYRWNRAKKHW